MGHDQHTEARVAEGSTLVVEVLLTALVTQLSVAVIVSPVCVDLYCLLYSVTLLVVVVAADAEDDGKALNELVEYQRDP